MKYSICNLGCKVNNYEANWYSQQLGLKYEEVPFGHEKADIYIINSCTVTNTAGSKTRQMMHKARKLNPEACICVVGCYVQMEYQKENIFADCDILIGSNHKKELPDLIEQFLENRQKIVRVEDFTACPFETMNIRSFNQTRAYLKIQDGCNQFCSYCVIPFARGRERSLDPDTVIEIANQLTSSGHKEIVLTGIHTGRYRYESTDFTALVKRILNEVKGLERLRVSSIEVTELTDEFIRLIRDDERMGKHLHVPLQTGSDPVLKAMRRPYVRAEYQAAIDKIIAQVPSISISSDVIVGFPQESDEDFRSTCEFIENSGLSFLHVFPYAAKAHTVAAAMKGQVREETKRQRVTDLTDISHGIYYTFIKKMAGKEGKVLFETYHDGILSGHNSEYVMVEVESEKDLSGQMCSVRYTEAREDHLVGELI